MIYLIGVNHAVQYKKDNLSKKFLDFIKLAINKYNIKIIAEEWNSDADSLNFIKESNLTILSKQLKIDIIQVEAEKENQKKFNIMPQTKISELVRQAVPALKNIDDIRKRETVRNDLKKINFKPRELYWIYKMGPQINQNILLVCGNDHVETFTKLLGEYNINSLIISRDKWVINEFPSNFWK